MNGLLDAKKPHKLAYPHGERREVMIATLRWAIMRRLLFPMVCAWMEMRLEGRRAGNSQAGNFILGGAERLFS